MTYPLVINHQGSRLPISALLESNAVIREDLETRRVSVLAAMAEEAMALATAVGSDGGNEGIGGGSDRVMVSSGAMAPRSDDEDQGQSQVMGGSEERATKAHGGGSEEMEPEVSPMRQPQSNLGKDLVVEEKPVVKEIRAVFVGSGEGAGSSRPISMGDFLEMASIGDLVP